MGTSNGLWTAVSGGMAQSQNLDIIANNIANANTAGFKRDQPTFKEYLTAVEKPGTAGIDIPRTAFKDSDFYHFDGRENAMVTLDKAFTDHGQGSMKPTGQPFDLSIEGKGFFAVNTPSGVMFTRAGNFTVSGQGQLVTLEGYPVLGSSGETVDGAAPQNAEAQATPGTPRAPAALNPFAAVAPFSNSVPGTTPAVGTPPAGVQLAPIDLNGALANGTKPTVTEDGSIYVGDQQVGRIAVAEFADAAMLKKMTSTMYSNPNPANVPVLARASNVHQGFLEQSNVNAVSEMVNMLKANRMYESNMRAIKAYSDMSAKEANEVGKL